MPEGAAVVDRLAVGGVPRAGLDAFVDSVEIAAIDSTGDLGEVITALSRAIRRIAGAVCAGSLAADAGPVGTVNVQGEMQVQLDVLSNAVLLGELDATRAVAGVVSEELATPYLMSDGETRGEYLLAIDPLDGSSNVEVNVPVGTIFSVFRRTERRGVPGLAEFLQPGHAQVCAGFALYGPATILVLATAAGVSAFTLDRDRDTFVCTRPVLQVPEQASEFAINVSNERFWSQPVRRFVADCVAGRSGVRQRDYNMRWVASLVAEAYRILTRGGVFLYPADSRSGTRAGRLRLLYECNPVAFVMEQAGGSASTGRGSVLDLPPTALHQRVPFVFGSRPEVALVESYHQDPRLCEESPLFNTRSLFRGW